MLSRMVWRSFMGPVAILVSGEGFVF
jgi:hypothetical protein